jgi:hypothetical protein
MTDDGWDDEIVQLLNPRRPSTGEREWMVAALRKAAMNLSGDIAGIERERGFGKKRAYGSADQNAFEDGKVDGLNHAVAQLTAWADACQKDDTRHGRKTPRASMRGRRQAEQARDHH